MNFDKLVADVLALASQRNVSATVHADHVIVSENDEFIADLRFSLSEGGDVRVLPIEADGEPLAHWEGAGTFSTVRDVFEHYDIG